MSAEEALALKNRLEKAEGDEEVTALLESLEKLAVDRPLLAKTKLGVAVARLAKKDLTEDVKLRGRRLVDRWKALVKSVASKDTDRVHDEAYSGSLDRDDKRNRFRQVLYAALREGSPPDALARVGQTDLNSLVESIETALFDHHVVTHDNMKEYANQVRSVKANLQDKRNLDFNRKVIKGTIAPPTLAVITSAEMASDQKKTIRQQMKKEQLEACQSDWELRNVKVSLSFT
ncbi:MAG: hypothetical protein KVP17_002738 [Porospora cf. gigantea B]|uniref:uncharacterized protein n=1 Tax=Porospora cf. gigantea B TaxID=2853592 RepID=UPI003571C9F3|nr:MAG: hypothetical protein KVP17_002738 [Porospora cf. gigantea B]